MCYFVRANSCYILILCMKFWENKTNKGARVCPVSRTSSPRANVKRLKDKTCIQQFSHVYIDTVDSRYLEFQGTLKYFEISVPRHIRFSE